MVALTARGRREAIDFREPCRQIGVPERCLECALRVTERSIGIGERPFCDLEGGGEPRELLERILELRRTSSKTSTAADARSAG